MSLVKKILHMIGKIYLIGLRYFKGGVFYARHLGVNIGEGCRIYTTSFGSEPFLITIGDRVTVTSGVKILTHDGSTWLIRKDGVRYQKYLPVVIGDDVFIGVNSIIMPGVVIGSKVIIGAGSVVTKDIPNNSVVVGTPAKVVSTFNEYEERVKNTCVNDNELDQFNTYREKVLYAVSKFKERP